MAVEEETGTAPAARGPGLGDLPPGAFAKIDAGDDAEFYQQLRLVTHIDERAVAALTDIYHKVLPAGGALLDLMSSWVSHLPDDISYGEVVGHGMNAEELAANPRLTRAFVQDLNREPALPLADASFDGAMICVAIQYLQRPAEVFTELARVLKPGAPLVVSFSNRCFPTKAVAVWRALNETGQAQLVGLYLESADFTDIETRRPRREGPGDPLTVVIGRAPPRP